MEEYLNSSNYINESGSIITIGTFDGVHLGHQAIIKRLVSSANSEGLRSVLLTFFPHPRMVLQENSDIKLLNTLKEKKELLDDLQLDDFIVEPFTKEFSRLSAEAYVRDLLVGKLKAKKIIIGYDHRFGRNRNADITNLKQYGKKLGFEVEEISAQQLDDVAISSTKIRNALLSGDITTANTYLGYPFMLTGEIISGRALGRTINYPTANLKLDENYKLIPMNGVYIVKAMINGMLEYGITNIGLNPTVGGTETSVETFFLDFDEDLYNKMLTIQFLTHIRDEIRFKSLEELKQAIKSDEVFARNYIKQHE
ncbi:bifunctional riboflavin kinase/FAD synthetase [Patiriisocius sp. Uisw_017]|jgi:riboflavin kinase/FMN adenylyltransferase|uniref:bifunctional riboflavin kinase/FAD synthetase n=1 Tax=Patiriisocius sp. Uisw_017 TaxID=3230968 RepID=UPI0039E99D10